MNLLRLLLFFPGITFSIISAEIFPYAFIYSCVMFIKNKKILIDKSSKLFFLLLLSLSSLFTLTINFKAYDEILRSLIAYLNVVLIFHFIINSKNEELSKIVSVAKISYMILLVIAIFQFFNLVLPLEVAFKFLIPRFSPTFLDGSSGSRGISLLSSEPSRASLEFIFLTLLMSKIHKLGKTDLHNNLIYFTIIFVANLFFFKSLDGLILAAISFIIFFRHNPVYLFFLVYFFLLSIVFNTRLETLVLGIISGKENFMLILSSMSGFRFSSIISSYIYGMSHLLGSGIGNWQISSLSALNNSGFDPANIDYFVQCCNSKFQSVRPTSFIANLMLDIGLIGCIFFLSYLISTSVKFIKEKVQFNFFLFFLVSLFLITSVGDPIPWICMAIFLRYKNQF